MTETSDITCVVTGHGEGRQAVPTLRSMERAAKRAEQDGLSIQMIFVLDRANEATRAAFKDFAHLAEIIETDLGDQGKARNAAVERATGNRVAFLDGDDLWSEGWLVEAYRFLDNLGPKVVAHPEFNYFFEGQATIFRHIDQDDPAFSLDLLRLANFWDALAMADRQAYVDFPFYDRDIPNGWAYEDWYWNCETVAAGYRHKIVPDTVLFKRRRKNSQTIKASTNKSRIPRVEFADYGHEIYSRTGISS